jgi:aerobic carbon-monoxide dehydrogenase small subunit
MVKINFTLNNKQQVLETDDSKRLIDLLREDLGLSGTKEGCGIGECGACTVIMNGKAVCSCLIMAGQIEGTVIETIENIEQNHVLSTLQQLFLEHSAVQCGYCTPGMLMSAKALLDEIPHPDENQIKEALEGNLCRCTGYIPIMNALKAAAGN